MKQFYFKLSFDIFKVSYQNGELDQVNRFNQNELIEADNLNNAIEELFKNKLFFDYNKKFAYFEVPFYETHPKNILTYRVLVDQDTCEVKEHHKIFKDWQQDKVILYSCNLQIEVFKLQEINLEETYFKNQ